MRTLHYSPIGLPTSPEIHDIVNYIEQCEHIGTQAKSHLSTHLPEIQYIVNCIHVRTLVPMYSNICIHTSPEIQYIVHRIIQCENTSTKVESRHSTHLS